jgi:hypothetical protein
MEKTNEHSAITTKPSTRDTGHHGKSVEAPGHHSSPQRRTATVDEEKKEKEAKARAMRKANPHHGHHHDHHHSHHPDHDKT